MAGPHREPAVAELGQNLADRTFVQFDAKPPLKLVAQIHPAANVRPHVAQDRDLPRPTRPIRAAALSSAATAVPSVGATAVPPSLRRYNDAPSLAGSDDPSRNVRLPSCGPNPPVPAPAPRSAALPYPSSLCVPPSEARPRSNQAA